MTFAKSAIIAVVLGSTALAGCQSSRMSSMGGQPEPLPAAPSGTVTSGQLPPPAAPGGFPEAPQNPQVAAVTPGPATPPANAPDVTKNSMLGSWNTSVGGSSCQVFLSLTKFGNASRGGSRGCTGDMQRMRSWDVQGKQVVMFDEGGNQIASVYASGANRFDGQTSSGQSVSLSR
ncbi:MAG: protease inhibitor Inh/omp19 family protein [Rhizobiaceae bacterium]|nr:protease inhibitor Inh/omp19 family protein [Rhizobiaceae bacterium]